MSEEETKTEGTAAPEVESLKEKLHQTTAQLMDYEKRFKGIDLDRIKADADAAKHLQKQLDDLKKEKATGSKSKDDFESEWQRREQELIERHKQSFESEVNPLKEKLTSYERQEYERSVVESVLSNMTGQTVPGSEEFWRDMIRKEIKKDESGHLVVIDEKGQVVYNDGRSALTIAQWIDQKKAKYPFLVSDPTKPGAYKGSEGRQSNSSGALTPPKGATEQELIQFYAKNIGKVTKPILY
jgi:hypothetical protein